MKSYPVSFYGAYIRPFLRIIIILSLISVLLLIIDNPDRKTGTGLKRFMLIQHSDTPLSEMAFEGIIDGFNAYGWVRDKDYQINVSSAQGDIAVLNLMVDAVLTQKPDLVFIISTPTLQSAIKKIRDIPVIFTVVADPILAGAGTTFQDHIPNITGISTLGDYDGMVKWVRRILPTAKSMATLYTPGELNSVRNMEILKKKANEAGMTLITAPVISSQDVVDALLSLCSRKPDVICQIVDNLTSLASGTIISKAGERNIPVFGFVSDQAKMGAVLVVSRDYHQAGVDAVNLAIKVLAGTNPKDIPFEYVSKTNVLINRSALKKFDLHIDTSLFTEKHVILVNE